MIKPNICWYPGKFLEGTCGKDCRFFEICTYDYKIIGYKLGKQIIYKDIKKDIKKEESDNGTK